MGGVILLALPPPLSASPSTPQPCLYHPLPPRLALSAILWLMGYVVLPGAFDVAEFLRWQRLHYPSGLAPSPAPRNPFEDGTCSIRFPLGKSLKWHGLHHPSSPSLAASPIWRSLTLSLCDPFVDGMRCYCPMLSTLQSSLDGLDYTTHQPLQAGSLQPLC